jgi:hypothetical protein
MPLTLERISVIRASDGAVLPDDLQWRELAVTIEAAGGARKNFKMLAYSGGALALKEYKHPVVVDLAGSHRPAAPDPDPGRARPRSRPRRFRDDRRQWDPDDRLRRRGNRRRQAHHHGQQGRFPLGSLDRRLRAANGRAPSRGKSHRQRPDLHGPALRRAKDDAQRDFFRQAGSRHEAHQRRDCRNPQGRFHDGTEIRSVHQSRRLRPRHDDGRAKDLSQSVSSTPPRKQRRRRPRQRPPTPPATPPVPGADLAKLAETITANLRAENAAEQKRIAAINAKCAGFPDLAAKGIAENWTPDKAELEVLRASRPDAPVIHAGAGQQEISASACMEAALCISGGINEARVGKWFDEKVMNEANSARFRGARISTLMFEVIRAANMHARLGAVNDSTIRTALNAERKIRNMPPIQATGFTTMSMSGILSNVARKALIASYEAAGVVWPYFTAIRDHADFKIYTRYRLDASGALRKVGPDGELKHVTLNEASFTNQLDTYGAIIALTQTDHDQ